MSMPREAQLALLGWNFRSAKERVRERVAFTPEEVREGLRRLLDCGLLSEGVIVSTCHRSEIYGLVETPESAHEIARRVGEWRGLSPAETEEGFFRREGSEAVNHLFRVAAGLDSMALGESEILGQVRQALEIAREAGTSRAVLHRLFESAVAAGKRVRTETEISVHPLSIASIGFELATRVFGDLRDNTALVLGAGETGALFARHAGEAGVRNLLIANRTAARAEELAARLGATPVPWEDVAAQLHTADVVVGATSSPQPVVRRAQVEAAMRRRRGRPMLLLDLAVPADIEPSSREIYNVFAYSLDDLEEVARENRQRRAGEIPAAERIVEEESQKFLVWYGNLTLVPTLTSLRRRFERSRDAELDRIPRAERERFRIFADAVSRRLLRDPVKRLKSDEDPARKLERAEALRFLFDLDGPDEE
jgi:glutamyl-tRNA reductase